MQGKNLVKSYGLMALLLIEQHKGYKVSTIALIPSHKNGNPCELIPSSHKAPLPIPLVSFCSYDLPEWFHLAQQQKLLRAQREVEEQKAEEKKKIDQAEHQPFSNKERIEDPKVPLVQITRQPSTVMAPVEGVCLVPSQLPTETGSGVNKGGTATMQTRLDRMMSAEQLKEINSIETTSVLLEVAEPPIPVDASANREPTKMVETYKRVPPPPPVTSPPPMVLKDKRRPIHNLPPSPRSLSTSLRRASVGKQAVGARKQILPGEKLIS